MSGHRILTSTDHGDLRVHTAAGAEYGDNVMACFTVPVEFRQVQGYFPIVFRRDIESGEYSVRRRRLVFAPGGEPPAKSSHPSIQVRFEFAKFRTSPPSRLPTNLPSWSAAYCSQARESSRWRLKQRD